MTSIAVLFHESTKNPAVYKVHYLAEHWRRAGYNVVYLFGTRRFVPANLLIVHVDLSIVPTQYLEFADRYPAALNRHLTDIRKSRFSKLIITPRDDWRGPVIAKTNLNAGGGPEKAARRTRMGACWLSIRRRWPLMQRVQRVLQRSIRIASSPEKPTSYTVYASPSQAPYPRISTQDWVLERFLPEMENGLYHVRLFQALGARWISTRIASPDPLVKAGNSILEEDIEPHPIVERWRREFKVDYGKLDYVVVDGEPFLLDINKTVGTIFRTSVPEKELARRRYLAEGIHSFLV